MEARLIQDDKCPNCGRMDGWHKAEGHPPPPIGDCRKIVWMRDSSDMEWWGVRAYGGSERGWNINGREESSMVLFWRDGPENPHYPAAPPEDTIASTADALYFSKVTYFVQNPNTGRIAESTDPYRRDYVSYQDFCVVRAELASLRETISKLEGDIEKWKNIGMASGRLWSAEVDKLEATISTLQGENQELRQVVKEYREMAYCGTWPSRSETRCSTCIKADALLAKEGEMTPAQERAEYAGSRRNGIRTLSATLVTCAGCSSEFMEGQDRYCEECVCRSMRDGNQPRSATPDQPKGEN